MAEEATGPYYSTDSASKYLDIPVSTLVDYRQRGIGPRWFKVGKRLATEHEGRACVRVRDAEE